MNELCQHLETKNHQGWRASDLSQSVQQLSRDLFRKHVRTRDIGLRCSIFQQYHIVCDLRFANCIDCCPNTTADCRCIRCTRLEPLWLDGLVWNFSSRKSSDSLAVSTGSFICLLFERCCPKLGPERYLFRNDAIYAHPTDRLDTYFYLSSNCTLAPKPSLWAVNLCLKKDQQFPILSGH